MRPTRLGTYINPGLAFQDMWFVMYYAADVGEEGGILQAARTAPRACEPAWDEDRGGIFQFVYHKGGPPRREVPSMEAGHPTQSNLDANWDGKLYWAHTGALYALLLSHYHTREPWVAAWYRRVHDYTFPPFPAPNRGGEWINVCNRDGSSSDKPAAVPAK